MDFNIRLRNGQVLNGIIQSPGDNAGGVVLLVHGLGEHIHRYTEWSDLFRKEGIAFAGVDLPGHGNSDGRRGHVSGYSVLDEMIGILIDSCRKTFPGIPVYLYGHSLGGGIVLNYILRKNPGIKGAIVTSPWLKLSFQPPAYKVLLATVMKGIIPGLLQPSGLNASHLSHDQDVVNRYKADPLVHDKISVALFAGAMAAADYTLSHASDLKIPSLLMHGSDDQICSPAGSIDFAGNAKNAELKIWDGGYHELHNEPFREEVFSYIAAWIRRKPA